jgi:hypothetical protein
MTFRNVYNEEHRDFRPLRAPPNVRLQINNEVLFIDKICNTPSPLRLGLSLFFFYNKIFAKIHKVYQST